ncbi:MAG: hypothetical protein KF774_03985 [Planctomyces sp.]|nr:hypothetical protein [Planctomyces sp.]
MPVSRSRPHVALVAAIVAALIVGPTSVGAEWVVETRAGAFRIRSEFTLSRSESEGLIREIGQLQEDVETLLAIQASDDPILLSLFRNSSSYRQHLAQRVPEAASRPALFVKGADMSRVYVYRRRGYEIDVRHECTHAVLHNALPFVPLWLDEGLAEYFEVSPGDRSARNPHLGSLRRSILFGWKPDLERLEALTELQQMGPAEYRESWAWVHFMLHGPLEVRQALSDHLEDLRQGETETRLSVRLRQADRNVDRRLVAHLRGWR